MSSTSFLSSRKRPHTPDFRDSSDSEDYGFPPPSKIKRSHHGNNFNVAIKAKLRSFAIWITELPVSNFFTMAIKSGSTIPDDTITIDDDDDDEDEEDDDFIRKLTGKCDIKKSDYDSKKLNSLAEKYKNSESLENNLRQPKRQLEQNGSYALGSHLKSYSRTNGSSSSDFKSIFHGNGNFSSRQPRTRNLKRPAIISNPPTDIEILLDTDPELSVCETDGIEILSKSHNPKQKFSSSQKPVSLSSGSSAAKHSSLQLSPSQSYAASEKRLQSSTKSFTANEVVKLQEKEQYKLLLEKYINGSCYFPITEKSQSDVGVQADTSTLLGSHLYFKKEILQQPVDSFIEKYYTPCRLLSPKKNTESSEKKEEPTEIKIEDDDDEEDNDDEVQIVNVVLPKFKPKFQAKLFTKDWLFELKRTLNITTKERKRIVEDQERILECYKKDRLLNRLRLEVPVAQAVEPEFPELTPEMEEAVDQALNTGAPEDRLCKITSDYLLRKDIETLNGLKWLNDLVINSYFDLIVERSKQEGYPSIHAYNTFFYSTYKTKGYSSVRRWTRKVDIYSFDLNFVPIHLGVHWCLAVIDHRSKEIRYYDSMGTSEEKCLDLLHEYLCLEFKDKKGQILDPSTYTTAIVKDIPQQMNGSDCGMFTLKYAEYISRDAEITFNQDHMQYFRRRMVYELLTCQLL